MAPVIPSTSASSAALAEGVVARTYGTQTNSEWSGVRSSGSSTDVQVVRFVEPLTGMERHSGAPCGAEIVTRMTAAPSPSLGCAAATSKSDRIVLSEDGLAETAPR